ncbi:hypothetical protein [Moorena bouillonii]|uniref:Prevent-host-death protein n=1 Tax=Moorena bouillonii PNG TaxID=568701 RepID=A0A1U7N5M1_9CYAN|nr:hypothetical protein [Moorena bouillonii]OLT61253.1 hypothetical protein BJP37_21765 [Moorena bouillonii PNG]
MFEIEYLTDKNGEPKAVVIPIEVWRQLFPEENIALDELSERLEYYCLNQAMDEAKLTPLLDREAALKYLE